MSQGSWPRRMLRTLDTFFFSIPGKGTSDLAFCFFVSLARLLDTSGRELRERLGDIISCIFLGVCFVKFYIWLPFPNSPLQPYYIEVCFGVVLSKERSILCTSRRSLTSL